MPPSAAIVALPVCFIDRYIDKRLLDGKRNTAAPVDNGGNYGTGNDKET